jgi:hypothetical protein
MTFCKHALQSRYTPANSNRSIPFSVSNARKPNPGVLSTSGIGAAITGNAKALLQLRSQLDCALRGVGFHPFEEGVY